MLAKRAWVRLLLSGSLLALVLVLLEAVAWHPSGSLYGIGVRPTPAGTSPFYQLLSGFIPALAVIPIFVVPVTWYYHHTCHEKPSCLRWGKYEVAGGLGRKCHRHHPDLRHHPREHHGAVLDRLHEEWKARQ